MTVKLGTDFRARSGLQTVGATSTAYRLTALAVQLDQRVGGVSTEGIKTHWQNPAYPPSTFPRPARIITRRNISRAPDGDYFWKWVFSRWTWGMWDYWMDTYLATSAESADITVATYNDANTQVFLQATVLRPTYGGIIPGGYVDVTIEFEGGTIIT